MRTGRVVGGALKALNRVRGEDESNMNLEWWVWAPLLPQEAMLKTILGGK